MISGQSSALLHGTAVQKATPSFSSIDLRGAPHSLGMDPAVRRRHQVVALLALTLAGCGSNTPSTPGGAGGDFSAGGSRGEGGEGGQSEGLPSNASALFEPQTLPTFELNLAPERWEYLQ